MTPPGSTDGEQQARDRPAHCRDEPVREAAAQERAPSTEPVTTAVDETILSPEQAAAERLPSVGGSSAEPKTTRHETASAQIPLPVAPDEVSTEEDTERSAGIPPSDEPRPRSDHDTEPSPGGPRLDEQPPVSTVEGLQALPLVSPHHYDMVGPYARGGIGEILEAYDRRLHRIVAIKQLRRSTRYARRRFGREVQITARLQHPSIIPVYEAGHWPEGQPFLAMKLVDGGSLEDAIAACVTRQDRLRLVRNVADVADAMAYAHSQGIVHRDLKPSNVLLGPFGETVVIDWGLAKDLRDVQADELPPPDDDTLITRYRTTDGVIMGTPHYMPPEQASGPAVDERADVYAIGALLYQVLAGRPPYFDASPKHVLARLAAGPPAPIEELASDAPRDLLAIVRKAMERRPADRYPTAREMARELQRFLHGRLVAAHEYSLGELLRRFVERHRAAVATAALGLLLLGVLATYSFVRISEQRDRAEASARGEARARQAAENRLAQAVLARARTAAAQDPTLAVALLKQLPATVAGAATVAADAQQRGVAYRVMSGHADQIDIVDVSSDGRWIASAGSDREVWLWERQSGVGRRLSGHSDRVAALAFVPGSPQLVTGSYDQEVRLWDVEAGTSRVLRGHEGPVKAIAMVPGGEQIASVGDDGVRVWTLADGQSQLWRSPADRARFALVGPEGRWLLTGSHEHAAKLWDLSTGEPRRLGSHQGEVRAAILLRDPQRIATASEDGAVRVWSLDGAEQQVLEGHQGGIESLTALPDGRRFVTGGLDGTVRLWRVGTQPDRVIVRHQERVATVAVSPDGRFVASGSWDKTIGLYDLQTSSLRRLRGHQDVVSAVRFSSDGAWLVSGSWDRQVRLWRIAPDGRRTLAGHRIGVKAVAFSPDGTRIASGGHDDTVIEWHAERGEALQVHRGHEDHVYRVLFSPDGTWIASSSDDRTVRLWRVGRGESKVLEGHQADVEELAFSPDSSRLASAGEDDAVGLWNVTDGSGELLRGHRGPVTAVAFSPDGKLLASAGRAGTLRLWHAATGREQRVVRGQGAAVTALAFSHGGGGLASAAADDGVRLWELAQGTSRLLGAGAADTAGLAAAERLAFSPDDRWLAAAGPDVHVRLCPVVGGACRLLSGHTAKIHALAFAQQGRCLVTASGDGTLRIFSVESGESRPLRGHAGPVFDLALSPDGARVASASADGTVRIWPLELPPAPTELPQWLDGITTFETSEPSP